MGVNSCFPYTYLLHQRHVDIEKVWRLFPLFKDSYRNTRPVHSQIGSLKIRVSVIFTYRNVRYRSFKVLKGPVGYLLAQLSSLSMTFFFLFSTTETSWPKPLPSCSRRRTSRRPRATATPPATSGKQARSSSSTFGSRSWPTG